MCFFFCFCSKLILTNAHFCSKFCGTHVKMPQKSSSSSRTVTQTAEILGQWQQCFAGVVWRSSPWASGREISVSFTTWRHTPKISTATLCTTLLNSKLSHVMLFMKVRHEINWLCNSQLLLLHYWGFIAYSTRLPSNFDLRILNKWIIIIPIIVKL